MARKVVALDIDFSKIKAVEMVNKRRFKVLSNFAEQSLSMGTVVEGKVAKTLELKKGLELLLSSGNFKAESAVLGVRSPWVTVKVHRFPTMSPRELAKAVEFEIPELFPFSTKSMDDLCYDFFVNSKTEHEIEVVIVACLRQHLTPYIETIREVGLTLEAIDVPAFGWSDLLRDEKRRAFVEISEEQTTVQVILGGSFKVLRMVPVGALQFSKGVQEAFGCSPSEAQALCEKHDLDYLLLEGEGNKRVIRATVQQFTGSILQTLDFVRAQEREGSFSAMLDEVVLIGDFADLRGLNEMLEREMGIRTVTLKQLDLRIGFEAVHPKRFSCFGSALALGLRGLEA